MSAVNLANRIGERDDYQDGYLEGLAANNFPQTLLEGTGLDAAMPPVDFNRLNAFLNQNLGNERFGNLSRDEYLLRRRLVTDPDFRDAVLDRFSDDMRPDHSARIAEIEFEVTELQRESQELEAQITQAEEGIDQRYEGDIRNLRILHRTEEQNLINQIQQMLGATNVDDALINAQNLRLRLLNDQSASRRAALDDQIENDKRVDPTIVGLRNRRAGLQTQLTNLQNESNRLQQASRGEIENRSAGFILSEGLVARYGNRVNGLTTTTGMRVMHEALNLQTENVATPESRTAIVRSMRTVNDTLADTTDTVLSFFQGIGSIFSNPYSLMFNERTRRFRGLIQADSSVQDIEQALTDNNPLTYTELCRWTQDLREALRTGLSVDAPDEVRRNYENLLMNMEIVRVRYSVNEALGDANMATMSNEEVLTAMNNAMTPEPLPEQPETPTPERNENDNLIRRGATWLAGWALERLHRNRFAIATMLLRRYFNRVPDPA